MGARASGGLPEAAGTPPSWPSPSADARPSAQCATHCRDETSGGSQERPMCPSTNASACAWVRAWACVRVRSVPKFATQSPQRRAGCCRWLLQMAAACWLLQTSAEPALQPRHVATIHAPFIKLQSHQSRAAKSTSPTSSSAGIASSSGASSSPAGGGCCGGGCASASAPSGPALPACCSLPAASSRAPPAPACSAAPACSSAAPALLLVAAAGRLCWSSCAWLSRTALRYTCPSSSAAAAGPGARLCTTPPLPARLFRAAVSSAGTHHHRTSHTREAPAQPARGCKMLLRPPAQHGSAHRTRHATRNSAHRTRHATQPRAHLAAPPRSGAP